MDELKETVAKNIVRLRTQAHLTQLQLAEKLNYSDKAVSKWERGEAIPDVRVLAKLAEIFNVTVDDIISDLPEKSTHKLTLKQGTKKILIVLLSAGLVWFIATILFMIFFFIPKTEKYAYLAFVIASLPCAIVLTVFSVKWGNWITNIITCSLILWSAAVIFYVFVTTFVDFDKMYFLYIVAGVFEVLIILWFTLRKLYKRKNERV